jgi:adenosylhomocysteine nucleosidase
MNDPRVVILISANAEWKPIRKIYPDARVEPSPFGEWFRVEGRELPEPVVFFHGGWGKIAAAASTQYAIDRWKPELLVNLGTCGGFDGEIERGEVILAERTVVYDIHDQMGEAEDELGHYSTEIDLSWLGDCGDLPVRRTLLLSADRDLVQHEIAGLRERHGGVAGDWESGAIAYVAARNGTRCLILRGVSDLVGSGGGEAYGNMGLFVEAAAGIMERLVEILPPLLRLAREGHEDGGASSDAGGNQGEIPAVFQNPTGVE